MIKFITMTNYTKDAEGKKAENIFRDRFNCKLVDDKNLQFKDIDAILNVKGTDRTVSIKNQETAAKTGNYSFEYLLENTQHGDKIDGNFVTCKADIYTILCNGVWYFWRTRDIHKFIRENEATLKKTRTKEMTEYKNRCQGRYYDRGWNYLVPRKELESIAIAKVSQNKPE